MKKVTIVFVGHKLSPALAEFGHSIGAQFRNAHLTEGVEPCDFVAGDPIPEAYRDHAIHPQWLALMEATEEACQVLDEEPETQDEIQDAETSEDPDEVEVTMEYLESLTKKEMLSLAEASEVELTSADKKSAESLREALADAFEL